MHFALQYFQLVLKASNNECGVVDEGIDQRIDEEGAIVHSNLGSLSSDVSKRLSLRGRTAPDEAFVFVIAE